MAWGLPRSGVAVKLQPQALQRERWWPRTVPFLTNAAPAHLLQLPSTNPALPPAVEPSYQTVDLWVNVSTILAAGYALGQMLAYADPARVPGLADPAPWRPPGTRTAGLIQAG